MRNLAVGGIFAALMLLKEQAKEVRGDYMQLYVNGYVNMYGFQGQVYLNGYVNYVYLWVQPDYFGVVAC